MQMQPSLEFISNYGLEEVAAPVHLADVFAVFAARPGSLVHRIQPLLMVLLLHLTLPGLRLLSLRVPDGIFKTS
jgi:hypothetical protein